MLLLRSRPNPKLQWLADQPWWRHLSRDDLRHLAASGDRTELPAGRSLMRQGHLGLEAAVIVAGEVEVVRDGTVVARLGPGDVVGELSLLDGTRRTADVRTITDVELLVFSTAGFRHVQHAVAAVREQVQAAAASRR